jgi:hypothetical protein
VGGPVFATKWDLLFAEVLIGVDRTTGVWSGSQSQGTDMVCVWTGDEIATEALHVESWELRSIAVRDLLAKLPAGVGVIVDPEHPSGMTCSPSYVANLKRYAAAFPPGESEVRLGVWDVPAAVRAAVVRVAAEHQVQELRAFAYTVDDGPLLGCLAHVAEAGADTSALAGDLQAAIRSTTTLVALGFPAVNVVGLADVPAEVRSALGDGHVVHRRRRRGLWR